MQHSEFYRKTLFPALLFTFAPALAAQGTPMSGLPLPSPKPSFDVATIKPHEGIVSITGLINRPDGLKEAAATLITMMADAYGVRSADEVSGGPAWVKADSYDVEAKMSAEDAGEFQKLSPDEMKKRRAQMLRTLLEERFHLQTHSVTKDVPVYELVVAKGGPKMKDTSTDTGDLVRKGPDGKPITGVMWFLKDSSTAQGYSMGALTNLLSQPFAGVGRPVVDKTGLTGVYNFTIEWSPQMNPVTGVSATASAPEDASSIFTAIQGLGLKLRPAIGSEQTIVIDHVERPTGD